MMDEVIHEERRNDSNNDLHRSTEYWYSDGNVVLVASNGVAYRVHASRLSQHSSLFRGMLTLPRPDTEELLEACPVVRLHDPESDLYAFLTHIYMAHRLVTY